MEYTSVLSLRELTQLFLQSKILVKPVGIHAPSSKEVIAPVTQEGKKILFELSVDQFHHLSEEHDFILRASHPEFADAVMGVPLHLNLVPSEAEVLNDVDENVKDLLRGKNDDWSAYACLPDCPVWNHLVRESATEKKVFSAELVLDGSEAPTNLMFLKPDGSLTEGSGSQFLLDEIGSLQNLKDYACNPTLELAWILRNEAEGGHRLRLKVHAVMFKKKLEEGLKTFKMSRGKVAALVESARLTKRQKWF